MKQVFLALIVLILCSTTTLASNFGIGVAGGLEFPIAQFDQTSGTNFTLKAILKAVPFISLEPHVTISRLGDGDFAEFGGDLEGADISAYGVDATLGAGGGPGVGIYLVGGGAVYKWKRDLPGEFADTDFSKVGWSAGLGLRIGFTPKLELDMRGKLVIIPTGDDGSKKSATVTAGLNYYFGF